ncbi:MAG: adenylosuccinate synthase [Anaerolineales bacterium]
MPLNIVVGSQWGDEGKGRIVDSMAAEADVVARYNGGDNAGHTVTVGDRVFKLHLVPSGIVHPHTVGVMGNGMVINPATLLEEIESLRAAGIVISPERLRISHAAHLITPAHRALDHGLEAARGQRSIGTTGRGIGPSYVDKAARSGLRAASMGVPEAFAKEVQDQVETVNQQLIKLFDMQPLDARSIAKEYADYAQQLAPYIADTPGFLAAQLSESKNVLAEGAQGTLLDLDHGTYPFVTSSSTIAAGALIGLGVGVHVVGRVIGVTKAFQTRVGSGPFPTEVEGDLAERLRGSGQNPWDEYGTTTGRPRRVGWLDAVLLKYSVRVNGLTELALTKLDVLTGLDPIRICIAYRDQAAEHKELPFGTSNLANFDTVYEELPGWESDLKSATRWDDLPPQVHAFVQRVQDLAEVPVRQVSVGPERDQLVLID